MNDLLKKLTGKNAKDFEPVAFELINKPNIALFKELVDKEDYLYDFVKSNVAERLLKNCNSKNYMNLIGFLKYYSPYYEDFIISTLVKYANEDLTDKMLEILEDGTEDEKTYCAKYFSIIQDPLALDLLREFAKSDNDCLSSNCAFALGKFGDLISKNEAYDALKSDDDYDILKAVKFLVSYADKSSYDRMLKAMNTSTVAEYIACEIPYLFDLEQMIITDCENGLYTLNLLINGLGESCNLSQIFDFRLYELFNLIIKGKMTHSSIVLLNAMKRFETLTENDEYLFDQTKETKQEINAIKDLLSTQNEEQLLIDADKEIHPESRFVYTALEFTQNELLVRDLLSRATNQTLLLKAIETLSRLEALKKSDKDMTLPKITNSYIRDVIQAI